MLDDQAARLAPAENVLVKVVTELVRPRVSRWRRPAEAGLGSSPACRLREVGVRLPPLLRSGPGPEP